MGKDCGKLGTCPSRRHPMAGDLDRLAHRILRGSYLVQLPWRRSVDKVADLGVEINPVKSVEEKQFGARIQTKADGRGQIIVKFADRVSHSIQSGIHIYVHVV